MEEKKLNNTEKYEMIKALQELQAAVDRVGELWQSEDGSGVTPFDEVLEKNYPFKSCFFDTKWDIHNWVEESVKEIRKDIKVVKRK